MNTPSRRSVFSGVKSMSRFERARIIGARAFQISMGAPPLVKLTEVDLEPWDPIKIARLESEKGLIPITVVREGEKKGK